MKSSGAMSSVWMTAGDVPPRPALGENLAVDVCVVGAGIAGLTTAYLLASEGRSVVLLDDGPVGGGETSRTSAHLVHVLDTPYSELERIHGEKAARLAAESHTAAIERIESIVAQERIDCEFERVPGYLFVPHGEPADALDEELQAAHRAGLHDVERLERAPLDDYETGPCLRFPRQAQFHPLKYMHGLAQAAEKKGARIFNDTRASEVLSGSPVSVKTEKGHVVYAGAVVIATHTPINERYAIHTKQAAYRTCVVALRVPKGVLRKALYWDTCEPYHYVRLKEGEEQDVLIVGGEDYKTGQDEDDSGRFARLEAWAREHFPVAASVDFHWSGQVMEPVDGLAFIGRSPGEENIYVITGDSGNGLTNGTLAAILLTDLIAGRKNEWESIYDPSRISLREAPEFIRENMNVAAQYADYVTAGDVEEVSQIAPGSGALIRDGLKKLAVYRDSSGNVHKSSAVCPHLGCIVDWNDTEKTWDCPCHGSRFDAYGKLLNGPANVDLEPAEKPRSEEEPPRRAA